MAGFMCVPSWLWRQCIRGKLRLRLALCLLCPVMCAVLLLGWSSMEWSIVRATDGDGARSNDIRHERQQLLNVNSHSPLHGGTFTNGETADPTLPPKYLSEGTLGSSACVALPSAHADHGLPSADVATKLLRMSAMGKLDGEARRKATESMDWRRDARHDVCDVRFDGNPGKVTQQNLDKANALHWMRTSGLLVDVIGCSPALALLPRPVAARAQPVPWQASVEALNPLPLDAHNDRSSIAQTAFVRAPKSASWVVGRDVCATCSDVGAYYMNPRQSCYLTLWGIGDGSKLKKLASTSRGGRNAIFKEREGSFQYGGIVPPSSLRPAANNSTQRAAGGSNGLPPHTVGSYVRGTTVWLGSYEGDNVGHVIHDALWALQITLMLPEILANNNPGGGNKGNAQREADVYPQPVRAVFAHDFERISSQYFGALSWVVANGEHVRAKRRGGPLLSLHRSPFNNETNERLRRTRGMVCFEQLVLPGQDRHVDGGGVGLRTVVARRIREHVFAALDSVGNSQSADASRRLLPVVFVYGRNDVHRRSFDNTAALYDVAALVARDLQLPAPVLIDSFHRPPEAQWSMMREVDVLLAIQGSHMQNSLFMPEDAAIIELAPCRADRVSFIQRYGRYLDTQSYTYLSLCDGVVVNYSDRDPAAQNVTLCPHMLARIRAVLMATVRRLIETRQRKKA